MLVDRVKGTIDRYAMISEGEKVLVAVSGGVDSIVLFDILQRLQEAYSILLVIAHLDHGLRGEESAKDAEFVKRLAAGAKVPIVSERVDLHSSSSWPGLGPEGMAREARRAFLIRAANDAKANAIALGHTSNDRAETVLLNLTRGAGPGGLVGFDPVDRPFIRPLIETTRDEIIAYAESQKLSWREDTTNADLSFSRNRIRHRVIPELSRINPRIVETICRGGDLVRDLLAANSYLLEPAWKAVLVEEGPGRIALKRGTIGELPPEVGALLVREGLRRARGNLTGIEAVHVEDALRLISSERAHGSLDLPGLVIRVQGDEVVLSEGRFPKEGGFSEPVKLGRNPFPKRGFTLDLKIIPSGSDEARLTPDDPTIELADADRIAFPLRLRTRRPGDRFVPLGMKKEVKLKDFLINESIPFFDRDDLPLLCDQERIIWVVGVRISDEVRLTDRTERILVMRVERDP